MKFADEAEPGTEFGLDLIFALQKMFITAKSTRTAESLWEAYYRAQGLAGHPFARVR